MTRKYYFFMFALTLAAAIPWRPGYGSEVANGKPGGSMPAEKRQPVIPMPLISRDQPAFASDGNAADGNSRDYKTQWCARTQPAWLAYDLSAVPVPARTKILAYFAINGSDTYDMRVIKGKKYDVPGPYVIEGNAAKGGGAAPVANWVTLVTGPDPMPYKCRQHVLSFGGYNWIRLRTRRYDPTFSVRESCCLKLDVYDFAKGPTDNWFFLGDSITSEVWHQGNRFAVLVNGKRPAFFPIAMGGGIPFMSAGSVIPYLPAWLADFPGEFVVLAYGTNDVNSNDFAADPWRLEAVYKNFETLVRLTIAAGKTPIIPAAIWRAGNPTVQNNLRLLNARLGVRASDAVPPAGSLRQKYPQLIPGPDLYEAFAGHPEWFVGDGMHPNELGNAHYQQVFADWALQSVYPAL